VQLFEMEIEDARKEIAKIGRNATDFDFKVVHLPPDDDGDGAGMFTARYEIDAIHVPTGKAAEFVGGIGLTWVDAFVEAMLSGFYD
jgi:hypothetical protein